MMMTMRKRRIRFMTTITMEEMTTMITTMIVIIPTKKR